MTRVLLTGSEGLMGTAIRTEAQFYPNFDFIFVNHNDFDLCSDQDADAVYQYAKPDYVIHTAAKVGGIGGNSLNHGTYFRDNILMNNHMIHYAMLNNVKKYIAFSSVCVFPHDLALLEENKMHDGPVFKSNFAYGYSKRMIDIQIQAYKSQYGIKNYCSVIPGNIFGLNDNYSLDCGHVIPMLIHKIYKAKHFGEPFEVWGDGLSMREFLYANDVAQWIIELLKQEELPDRIIMSGDAEYSIREIVYMLCEVADFTGEVKWRPDLPNGQRSRPSSKELFNKLLPNAKRSDIKEALNESYQWFSRNYPNVRGVSVN